MLILPQKIFCGFFMHASVIYNGEFYPADQPLINADHNGLKYGDGCFETMRICNGIIPLAAQHKQRCINSLQQLQFSLPKSFDADAIFHNVLVLAEANQHTQHARARISFIRNANNEPDYIIQSFEADPIAWNDNGLTTAIYTEGRKQCDVFSGIKSNNYQLYSMAARWASQQQLNDAIILNSFGNIAESAISNLFIVKDNMVLTPSLQEGCIAGVMRQHLIQMFRQLSINYKETIITPEDIVTADEMFLTNAFRGIQWVQSCGNITFTTHELSRRLFDSIIQPLFHHS